MRDIRSVGNHIPNFRGHYIATKGVFDAASYPRRFRILRLGLNVELQMKNFRINMRISLSLVTPITVRLSLLRNILHNNTFVMTHSCLQMCSDIFL